MIMYLLNDSLILRYVNGPKGVYLDIDPFEERGLHPTYYYFRLGHLYKAKQADGNWEIGELNEEQRSLILEPEAYAHIKSLERFYLSEKVMAIFGQTSDLAGLGLQLVHSPFIDPFFDGHLDLSLYNRTSKPVEIQLGWPIGKIKFFDVSDTYPIRDLTGTISEQKFRKRSEFRDTDPTPPWDDSYEPYSYDWRRR
jgi:deoxycytidine triphosphate deaminase